MSNKSPDEQSKAKIAKRVITPKRKYFVPSVGREIEADDLADLDTKLKQEQEEVGDDAS